MTFQELTPHAHPPPPRHFPIRTLPTLTTLSLVKEVSSYKIEAADLQLRVQSMEAAGEDEYEVRQAVSRRSPSLEPLTDCASAPLPHAKHWLIFFSRPAQKRVQAESAQMIPDSEKRLAQAIADLQDLVVCRPLNALLSSSTGFPLRSHELISLPCFDLRRSRPRLA